MVIFNCCNITDRVYRGWEAEGGLCHPQGDTQQQCVPSRAPKQSQSTWQAETVVGSNLTHHVALLVPLSGSIDPVVDPRGFTGSAKDCL